MNLSNQLFTFFQEHRGLPFRTMTVFNFLLEAALFGSLLIVLLLLVRKFLRGKLGNRVVYMAWLLVAIRLLVPLALPNPLMNDLRPTFSTDEAARPVADQIRVRTHDTLIGLSYQMREAETSNAEGALSLSSGQPKPYTFSAFVFDMAVFSSYGWMGKWIFFAYLAADGGVLLYMIAQNVRFRHKLKRNRVSSLEGEQLEQYLSLCAQRKVKPIPVYYVDPLPSACLVGVMKPYIALPLNLSEDELPQVLTHEICHLKAGDPWWAALRNLCCVVHWFNPLVWIAARCVRTDCELACDERVTEQMNEEERVAYAGTLVLAAAKRNAPRMSVLATGMTMNGKRLKQRVKTIINSPKKVIWLVAVVAVMLVLLTTLAFFTAEKPAEDYDLQMQKAARRFFLDEPFTPGVPENVYVPMRSITTPEEALAYARELMDTPYLRSMYSDFWQFDELTVSSFGDEWRVFCPTIRYGFELYFDKEGRPLYWNTCYPQPSEDFPYEHDLIRDPVDAYIRQFAHDCLGDPAISSVVVDDQRYTIEIRYAQGRTIDENGDALFGFTIEPGSMRMIRFIDYRRTAFGDGTFFSHAIGNLRDCLLNTTSLTTEDIDRGHMTVEALDEQVLCTTLTVAADQLSADGLSDMRSRYGERTTYQYEYITDRYGVTSPYHTKEAYLRRNEPLISQEAASEVALQAAAVIFCTETANIRCSTTDHYPEMGWYRAYCVYAPENTELLVTVCVNDHDGRVMDIAPVNLPKGQQKEAVDLTQLTTPSAELATLPPTLLPTNTPVPQETRQQLIFVKGDQQYLLGVEFMSGGTISYGTPQDTDLTITDAGRIAVHAVCDKYGLSYTQLPNYYLRGSFLVDPNVENTPKWWFNLVIRSTGECRYTIGVSSPEGEVVDLSGPGDGNG
ncbi:MAG: M56 family metallopeptidase [Clostridiales bacterium]|nr:M56 family metallopeptidase [Clostridiales bacterium]